MNAWFGFVRAGAGAIIVTLGGLARAEAPCSGGLNDPPASKPAAGTARDPALPEPGATCLLVPLHGAFGKEITGPGVRNALRFAKEQKITHVILDFDTPGGVLADGQAVAAQIRDMSDGLVVHAVIREAFSAATWPMIECTHIWVAPDARAGAAVAFKTKDKTTGAVEVDRKFNAALATRMAARAQARGLPGPVFRAMVDMEAQVWMVKDSKGAVKFFDSKPAGEPSAVEIDSKTSVLAMTAPQMIEYGIAQALPAAPPATANPASPATGNPPAPPAAGGKKLPKDLAIFGTLIDGDKPMREGAAQIQRTNADLERAEKKWVDANDLILTRAKQILDEGKRAAAADPTTLTYYYREGSKIFTPESQKAWRNATDQAVGVWRSVLKGTDELDGAVKSAEAAGKNLMKVYTDIGRIRLWEDNGPDEAPTPVDHKLDLAAVRQTAKESIDRLVKNREKSYIDK